MTHPMLVHMPLGLAVVMPLVAVWLLWQQKQNANLAGNWILVLLLQTLLTVGTFSAVQSGEAEEERVEHLLPESALHDHEELGESMFRISLAGTLLVAAALFYRERRFVMRFAPALLLVFFLLQFGVSVLTGKAGGALVWEHGQKLLQ